MIKKEETGSDLTVDRKVLLLSTEFSCLELCLRNSAYKPVVYFDQPTVASHTIFWLKLFFLFFKYIFHHKPNKEENLTKGGKYTERESTSSTTCVFSTGILQPSIPRKHMWCPTSILVPLPISGRHPKAG